ncbi:MAG: hypothetical protein UR53_C0006G0001 [Candidatus Magasanikbacteria bacterium GW2011_GWC2_34_16]|uniref:Uncharacterized protein n=2 Tax=Candidatus Magasanikiibacteriota TaxID=1752731 RepID=A0A0G0JQI4_9BACT|nr:MAG: hypothetical protein UR53_C0006G0001 [Candidatus Magasanikbacteria bacterium GW2011_GWC2_34_16]KKQ39129.1 MAG: hypothetical protein US58_C0040G0002 [Candidatus Magasanikbacteria bacterium GW2011_GWA2_37_8]
MSVDPFDHGFHLGRDQGVLIRERLGTRVVTLGLDDHELLGHARHREEELGGVDRVLARLGIVIVNAVGLQVVIDHQLALAVGLFRAEANASIEVDERADGRLVEPVLAVVLGVDQELHRPITEKVGLAFLEGTSQILELRPDRGLLAIDLDEARTECVHELVMQRVPKIHVPVHEDRLLWPEDHASDRQDAVLVLGLHDVAEHDLAGAYVGTHPLIVRQVEGRSLVAALAVARAVEQVHRDDGWNLGLFVAAVLGGQGQILLHVGQMRLDRGQLIRELLVHDHDVGFSRGLGVDQAVLILLGGAHHDREPGVGQDPRLVALAVVVGQEASGARQQEVALALGVCEVRRELQKPGSLAQIIRVGFGVRHALQQPRRLVLLDYRVRIQDAGLLIRVHVQVDVQQGLVQNCRVEGGAERLLAFADEGLIVAHSVVASVVDGQQPVEIVVDFGEVATIDQVRHRRPDLQAVVGGLLPEQPVDDVGGLDDQTQVLLFIVGEVLERYFDAHVDEFAVHALELGIVHARAVAQALQQIVGLGGDDRRRYFRLGCLDRVGRHGGGLLLLLEVLQDCRYEDHGQDGQDTRDYHELDQVESSQPSHHFLLRDFCIIPPKRCSASSQLRGGGVTRQNRTFSFCELFKLFPLTSPACVRIS